MSAEQFIEILRDNYLVIVVSMFLLFAIAEMVVPLSTTRSSVSFRWFTNVSAVMIIVLIFRLGGPVFALLTAWLTEYLGLGLFNNISLSLGWLLLLSIVVFDIKQYLFHRMMHYFDVLWHVHQVHHSDIEIDLTTGFRFHPLEAILSALFDLIVIIVFGIPAEALLLRYLLIYLMNFFSHADMLIPPTLDRYLKWFVVTPSMHHLHHALDIQAANHNFGVFFSCWDRIFGTFMSKHPQMDTGQGGYIYGVKDYREPGKLNLWLLMLMPFKSVSKGQDESATS